MIDESAIRLRYEALGPALDKRRSRRFALAEAASGHGGVSVVSKITAIASSTIGRGLAELRGEPEEFSGSDRIRRAGGGRKRATEKDPTLLSDLELLVDPVTHGDPMNLLLWTAKSLRNLTAGLKDLGHSVCHNVVAGLLRNMATAFRAIARLCREGIIPTATRNSATSTNK